MAAHTQSMALAFPAAVMQPLTGQAEMAIAEAAAHTGTRPETVSRVLAACYASIAGEPVSLERVRKLYSGTREWLLQQAAIFFHPELYWFETRCAHCGETYDLPLRLSQAARYQPEHQQVIVELETSLGKRQFQVPTGEHEEAFARLRSDADPRRLFAALCALSPQAEGEAQRFTHEDLERIDQALEEAAPEIADVIQTVCPACEQETTASIDPLLFAFPSEETILQETHLIASTYGWPHDQIAALSVRHRSHYAAMIERDRRQRLTQGWGQR